MRKQTHRYKIDLKGHNRVLLYVCYVLSKIRSDALLLLFIAFALFLSALRSFYPPADGAAETISSIGNRSLPDMPTFGTYPPYLSVGTYSEYSWVNTAITGVIPFLHEVRPCRIKIVHALYENVP